MPVLISKFKQSESGNVAMITAIVMVPLLICIGVGVDMTRLTSAHNKLQSAADSAALSAANAYVQGGKRKMRTVSKEVFESNVSEENAFEFSEHKAVLTADQTVQYSSKGSLKPMFPRLFGYPTLEFDVEAEATLRVPKGLEVAIAFDSTASMGSGSTWQDAMAVVGGSLESMRNMTGEDNFNVSLVPFSDRVNIGRSRGSWVAGPVQGNWRGCVEPREEVQGEFQWMADDDTAGSEPFTATGRNQRFPNTLWRLTCPSVAITGPTNEPDDITRALRAMRPGGTGRFDPGLAWAWRLLSPEWAGEWGVRDYPALDTKKINKKLIFVSDGKTLAYDYEMSQTSGWGYNTGSVAAFEHMVEMCRRIKEDDIEIYMVQPNGNPHATSYFQECATSPDHYYAVPNGSDVTIAFEDILSDLTAELRLLR